MNPATRVPVDDWKLDEATLLQYVPAQVLEAASDLAGLGRVSRCIRFDRELVGDVRAAEADYRASVWFSAGRLHCDCTCGSGRACPHGVAVLLAFLQQPRRFLHWGHVRAVLEPLPDEVTLWLVERLLRDDELVDDLLDRLSRNPETQGELVEWAEAQPPAAAVLLGILLLDAEAGKTGTLERVLAFVGETVAGQGSDAWWTLVALATVGHFGGHNAGLLASWARRHYDGRALAQLEAADRSRLLRSLSLALSTEEEWCGVLTALREASPQTDTWEELWRTTLTAALLDVRAELLNTALSSRGEANDLVDAADHERRLTRQLGAARAKGGAAAAGESHEYYGALLAERTRWFSAFVPALAAREAEWTAGELDRLGAYDAALSVLRAALSVAPPGRPVRGLRSAVAGRLMERGQPREAATYWVANFEEKPDWSLYRRLRAALDDPRMDAHRGQHARQLVAAAREHDGLLALRIAVDMELAPETADLLYEVQLEPTAAGLQLLHEAGRLLAEARPPGALELLQDRLKRLLQENNAGHETQHDVVQFARLVRGFTYSARGPEAWQEYMTGLVSGIDELPGWWHRFWDP